MTQFRIPFLPSERRKPCSVDELFDPELLDEGMIFVESVGGDIVTLQVM